MDLLLGVGDPVPVVVVDVLGGGARAAAGDQDVAAELSRGSAVVRLIIVRTSFPYFGVKLSCVCLMIAYRKKMPKVTQR